MTKLVLLDGHSLAYRAFYALPPDLATPSGQVTNAVFGFTSMLIKLLAQEAPDAIAVAWDRSEPTFRSERYSEYKATRESAPDLFRSQVPIIKEVLEALEIPQVSAAGFEADDVIATLLEQGRDLGYDVLVVTGDRDAFQLSSSDVTILYTRKGISDTVHATPEWIRERYGVSPERYVEYAALRGDTSDNLPGVPGVGEKTAARLISEYSSLEELYEHLDDLTPKLRDNLEGAHDQVMLNRELMTMVRDVPFDELSPEDLVLRPFDRDVVRSLFDDLAFRSLWERLETLGGITEAERAVEDVEVVTATTSDRAVALGVGGPLAIDPVWEDDALLGFVVAGEPVTYVPLEVASSLLASLTAGEGIIAHDAKPILRALLEADLPVPTVAFDTMLAAWVINPAQRAPSLDDLASRELGIEVGAGSDRDGGGEQGAFSFEESAVDLATPARRSIAVERLVAGLTDQLTARGSRDLYVDIAPPPLPLPAPLEPTGAGLGRLAPRAVSPH